MHGMQLVSPCRGGHPPASMLAPRRPTLHVYREHAPGRAAVEQLVRCVYRERYAADVREFAPVLVALQDGGQPLAAAGYRQAGEQPLFLERYLDAPVQQLLGDGVDRAGIVEVGHLATASPGEGRRLIARLVAHLHEEGHRWVVCTVTEELRHLFVRLGIAPVTLGVADPAVLGDDAARWGRYYDHRPLVLAGRLDAVQARLARRGEGA